MQNLPIDAFLNAIGAAVKSAAVTLIQASPGSGKTTRVPPALLDVLPGKTLVLEPRRLAARLAAERIAAERGDQVGGHIGYQMRFEQALGKNTRLIFITEGLLPMLLHNNPTLAGVDAVILDEFHERHLQTDIAFALVQFLQTTRRPDLKIILMSATLDLEPLRVRFPEAPYFDIKVPLFPVQVSYRPRSARTFLEAEVAAAVIQLAGNAGCQGHVLVFLSGAADIRRARELCQRAPELKGWDILELRASTPRSEQARVFAGGPSRKIILATNVAETSVTIPGVGAVVDSGIAKLPSLNPWTGMPSLAIKAVSQASCVQRAGRAGRTGPGLCVRLFSEQEFLARAPFEQPEILRLDLAAFVLLFHGLATTLGTERDIAQLPWISPPRAEHIEQGCSLLQRLRFIDKHGALTERGKKASRLPLHPRLGAVFLECIERGFAVEGAVICALLSEGAPQVDPEFSYLGCDVAAQYASWRRKSQGQGFQTQGRQSDPVSALAEQLYEPLYRAAQKGLEKSERFPKLGNLRLAEDIPFGPALLAGFPDRVALVRSRVHGRELNFATGGHGKLAATSCLLPDAHWVIAIDAEEKLQGQGKSTVVTAASPIDATDLLAAAEDFLSERRQVDWDDKGRLRASAQILYGQLVLDESPVKVSPEERADLFKVRLKEIWPKPFNDISSLQMVMVRLELLKKFGFIHSYPDFLQADFEPLLEHLSVQGSSLEDIAGRDLGAYGEELLPEDTRRLLHQHTPPQIRIGSGIQVDIHYEEGKPPWIQARLQQFFGSLQTPTILQGKMPLVVHLLAPNMRALQVTQDLASFWRTAYPKLRPEYMRKYPRHFWPENPADSEPPPPGRPKPRK